MERGRFSWKDIKTKPEIISSDKEISFGRFGGEVTAGEIAKQIDLLTSQILFNINSGNPILPTTVKHMAEEAGLDIGEVVALVALNLKSQHQKRTAEFYKLIDGLENLKDNDQEGNA